MLQEDLRKLEEWSKKGLLLFSEKICVHLIISNGRSNREIRSQELEDKQHETVGEKKYLGRIIDSKLSFASHIFVKVKKANSIMAVFKKTIIKMTDYTCVFKCL